MVTTRTENVGVDLLSRFLGKDDLYWHLNPSVFNIIDKSRGLTPLIVLLHTSTTKFLNSTPSSSHWEVLELCLSAELEYRQQLVRSTNPPDSSISEKVGQPKTR